MDNNRYAIQFEKDKTFLKAFLHGRGYVTALKTMGFIERETVGKLRKDGKMPEMHHMVRLALFATQLNLPHESPNSEYGHVPSLEEKLITVLLIHDAIEDDKTGEVTPASIRHLVGKASIADPVWLMTKKYRGERKDKAEYIFKISQDLLASLGKGIDRNDNLEHMIGVFDLPKIIEYTNEARTEFLPMLKKASKLYPEHLPAFQQIMYSMKRNIKFLDQYIELASKAEVQKQQINQLNDRIVDRNGVERDHKALLDEKQSVISRQATAIDSLGQTIRDQAAEIKRNEELIKTFDDKITSIDARFSELPDKLFEKLFAMFIKPMKTHEEKVTATNNLRALLGISNLNNFSSVVATAPINPDECGAAVQITSDPAIAKMASSKYRDKYK